MSVCLTFDTDWASEPVLEYTLSILERYGVKTTIFATNESRALSTFSSKQIELAIHPKFEKLSSEPIENLLETFPEAKGYRSHGLVDAPSIRDSAYELGLTYDSNLYLPENIEPFKDFSGLIRVPFCWSDFVSITANQGFDFNWELPEEKMFCIAFHPIHIFLNSESMDRYRTALGIADHSLLEDLRNISDTPGAEDALIKLLESQSDKNDFIFLAEAANKPAKPSVGFPYDL